VLVLRIVDSLGWVFGYSLGGELQFGRGEVGWERRRRRNRGRECRQMGAYNDFFRRNHRRNTSVGDSVGESATSLYGYLSLNPLVISVGKIFWRHHAVAYFQTSCVTRRRNRRYIPTEYFRRYIPMVSPTDLFRRYIPTDFETELFPSVYITDGIIPSVIPLLFSGFLVVFLWSVKIFFVYWFMSREKDLHNRFLIKMLLINYISWNLTFLNLIIEMRI